ncbi:MAG: glycosyltransferase family 2 protein [Planctomycetaceae bacterium]|nr:glycosyltransferase family 2 protein [Planctomycetaceae bacterium]
MSPQVVASEPALTPVQRRVAILIVSYEQPELLRDCLRSVLASVAGIAAFKAQICVVDNASNGIDVPRFQAEFPTVEFLKLAENRGFAGGNNAGWEHLAASDSPPDYLALLNPDTLVSPDWLTLLVDRLESAPEVAAAQPAILLHPETDRINTLGNDCHYLGFGLMRGYQESAATIPSHPCEIPSASGAAVLLRARVLREVGLFDERYFLYLEDTELGWKLRLAGYRIELVPLSRIYHRYVFQAPHRRYGYLERNRWWLLTAYYRWPTLLLLSPMLLAMECGQWGFAVQHGLVRQRLWAMRQLGNPRSWGAQAAARRHVQALRKVTDYELTRTFTATFSRTLLPGAVVQRLANPLLAGCWCIARRCLWW